MCTIQEKSKKKKFTGYKVAVEVSKRYYSPFTGLRYEVGKVKPVKKYRKNRVNYANCLDPGNRFYSKEMIGKTGVLESKEEAKKLTERWNCREENYVLLEITIKGDLYNASFDSMETMVGNEIVSMKKIKTS